jgi:hypothetical protein
MISDLARYDISFEIEWILPPQSRPSSHSRGPRGSGSDSGGTAIMDLELVETDGMIPGQTLSMLFFFFQKC